MIETIDNHKKKYEYTSTNDISKYINKNCIKKFIDYYCINLNYEEDNVYNGSVILNCSDVLTYKVFDDGIICEINREKANIIYSFFNNVKSTE